MTKKQKDKIIELMAAEKYDYAKECEKRITAEQGKIIGADWMIKKLLDILESEIDEEE